MSFPSFPGSSQDIYNYPGRGEYMACTIVHNRTARQLMAFRKLRLALGEQDFRQCLVEALDILGRSTGIRNPSAWLYSFLKEEADHA